MTTFEEICSSPEAHWEFFTCRARTCLICYRQTGCKLERAAFRMNMKARRERMFLEGS